MSVGVPASRVLIASRLAYTASGNQLSVVDIAAGVCHAIPDSAGFWLADRSGALRERRYAFLSGSDTFSIIDIANEGGRVCPR